MAKHFFDSTIAVINVKDYSASRIWYVKLLGEPAVEPEPGTGEWKIGSSWLQVTENPHHAGHSVAILGSSDIKAQEAVCRSDGSKISEIQDFGFIKLAELNDPDGNVIQIVEEVQEN